MKLDSVIPGIATPSHQTFRQRFLGWPNTRLGWWSIGLGATFEVLWIINSFLYIPFSAIVPWRQVVLPIYSIIMLTFGLAAIVVGLITIVKDRERSWLIWLAILPGFYVLLSVLIEFIQSH